MNALPQDTLVHTGPEAVDAADLMADVQTLSEIEEPSLAFRDAGTTRIVPLRGEHFLIGRSQLAQIRFDDSSVSRRHALVVIEDDGVVKVLDENSLNGVFVNGERVQSHPLSDGDELTIGRYRLRFLAGARRFTARSVPTLSAIED